MQIKKIVVVVVVEVWTKIIGKLSCMQVKCLWLLPTHVDHVEYARVQDINFTSAKQIKADLDEKISNISDFPFTNSSPQQAATKKIPEPMEAKWMHILQN